MSNFQINKSKKSKKIQKKSKKIQKNPKKSKKNFMSKTSISRR